MNDANSKDETCVEPPRQVVIYATDKNFWPHTYVSLHSLLANNQDVPFDVWILAEAPDPQFFANVAFLRSVHGDARVSWLQVDALLFTDVPVSYYVKTNYYRLLAGRLLPNSVRRVLYLDSDTVVRGSLRELFTFDIGTCVVAAAADCGPIKPVRLGLPEDAPYFNSGVLLFNLERWRALHVEEKCLDYLQENRGRPERLEYVDQDVLNAVLFEKWKDFGSRFNFTGWMGHLQQGNRRGLLGSYMQTPTPEVAIAHYTGPLSKPWEGGSRHPYAADYWHYRQRTPYADRLLLKRVQVSSMVRKLPWGEQVLQGVRRLMGRGVTP